MSRPCVPSSRSGPDVQLQRLVTLVTCAAGLACAMPPARAQQISLTERVRAEFVSQVTAGVDEYQIIETVGNRAKRQAALAKGLGVNVFAQATSWDVRDVSVIDAARTTKAHLGILRLQYANGNAQEKELAALRGLKGTFAGSEVLTHFATVPAGDSLLILYTETVLNDRVKAFLERAPALFGSPPR
jgi:hypothetical protein